MSYSTQVLADGATAYWRLNETTGTIAHDSVGTAHGTISATGVTRGVAGALADGSTAMAFDGVAGEINLPFGPHLAVGTGPLSLEVWIRTGITVSGPRPLNFWDTLGFHVTSGPAISFTAGTGANRILTALAGAAWRDNAWHHLVGVVERGTSDVTHLYVDGALVADNVFPTAGLSLTPGSAYLGIGAFGGGLGDYFTGSIDEVAVYPVALTPAQIATHYALRTAPADTLLQPGVQVQLALSYADRVRHDGATAYWRLNEASGSVAADSIGGAPGTITGGVTLGAPGAVPDGTTAMLFDGATGKIATTAPVILSTPFTLEAWIQTSTSGFQKPIFSTLYNTTSSLFVALDGGKVFVYPTQAGVDDGITGVRVIADGAWHHIGVVLTSTTVAIYIDGVLDYTRAIAPVFLGPTTLPIELGHWNLRTDVWPGSLDEVAIYPYALSAAQIAEHYALRADVVWTDLTPDVIASAGLRATRGIPGSGPLDRVAMPGVLTFTLRNDAGNSGRTLGWYSPDATHVRLGWTAGIPVRLTLTHEITTWVIWTGRIRTIAPEPGRLLSRYVEVTAQDAIADLTETIVREIPPQVNQEEDALVSAVVASMPASVQPPLDLDPGLDTLPYVFDDIGDGASALQLVSDVMLSSFGTLFVGPDGTLVNRNRQVQSRQTSSDTFTEDDLINDGGLVLQSGLGSVYNRVRATVHPRTLGATATDVLYAVTGTILVAPGETVTIWGSYADQSHLIRTVGGVDFQVPLTAGTDYAANSAPGGGGSIITGSITVAVEPFASGVQFAVTNTGGTPAYLVNASGVPLLQVRGRAIYDNAPITVERVNPQPYGDRLLNLDLKYQDDVEVAQGMVDLLLSRYQDPRNRVVRVGINASQSSRHLHAALEREVGDVLTIPEPVTGISDALLMIRGVEWDIQLARPALVRAWWSMAPSLSLSGEQWILDDAIFSILDETTILGVA